VYHQCRCLITVATLIFSSIGPITYGQVIQVVFVNDDAPPDGDGQTWATAYQHLQQGLESAEPGEDPVQIWVAQGVYTPTRRTDESDSRSATFRLKDRVQIYGGFAGTESTLEERAGHLPIINRMEQRAII